MKLNSFSKSIIPQDIVSKALDFKLETMSLYNQIAASTDYDSFADELKRNLKHIGSGSSKIVVEIDTDWIVKVPLLYTDEPAKEVAIIAKDGEINNLYPPSKHLGDNWILQRKVQSLDGNLHFKPEEITDLVNRLDKVGVNVTDLIFTEPYVKGQKLYYDGIRHEQFGVLDGKLVCIDFGYVD